MANEYLQRTPTSTGNRKVWTWSGWVKRNQISNDSYIFSAGSLSANWGGIHLNATLGVGLLEVVSSIQLQVQTSEARRDVSSWLNVVVSVDTTKETSENRVKMYVNGINLTSFQSYTVTQNYNTWVNSLTMHGVGRLFDGGTTFATESEMFDVFFVDGQALTPDVFGFYKDGNGYISAGSTQATDFRPGQWVPKTPRVIKAQIERNGGFGVNGFYLPMNDSSNFGADFHTTPNSIIKLQEDLPQPKVSITSTAQTGLGYTDVLRADPYAANLVLAIPFVNSGLCTDGTNSGISTGFGDYSHIINTSQTAKDVQLITYNGTTPTIVSYASSSTNYYGSACYIDGNGSAHAGGHIRVVDDNIFDDLNLTTANWTIEGWFNPASRSTGGSNLFNFGDATDFNQIQLLLDSSGNPWHLWSYTGSDWNVNDSGTTTRPPLNQWSHIAFEKVGTATTSYITTYVNGIAAKVTNVPQNINYSSNPRLIIGGHYLSGGSGDGDTFYYDGLVSDIRMYNVAKYKGGFDVPKPYTPVGIATWRAVPDTTANNFATLNPSYPTITGSDLNFSNGNLTLNQTTSDGGQATGSIGFSTGKWYFEGIPTTSTGSSNLIGIRPAEWFTNNPQNRTSYRNDGSVYDDNNNLIQSGTTYTTGDVIGVAIDMNTRNMWFSKNGSWVYSGDPDSGTSPAVGFGSTYTSYTPALFFDNAAGTKQWDVNFGQNPTFSGVTTAGTFTDSNGKGLFKYEPPSGFLALCEDNLPTPATKNPGEYFKTVLYTGTGSSRSVVGVGFTPDLVWVKSRTNTEGHIVFDSVRGPEKRLLTMTASTESTTTGGLMSFDEDGYSTATYTGTNQSGQNYVAWCWRAGVGTTSTNTDGTIPSVVSVNQDAGFSIVSWTSTGSNDALQTVGHGLNTAPNMIILKNRDAAVNWRVYHSGIPSPNNSLCLNTTEVAFNQWPSVDDDTFGLANSTTTGQSSGTSGQDIVAYCWTEIEGFSKFGSYVGNGSADGPFIYTGGRPAFVMIKSSTVATNWYIFDSSRKSSNPITGVLFPNTSDIETFSAHDIDFLSNGFKIRQASGFGGNNSGETYIFAAFAESPFQTANSK